MCWNSAGAQAVGNRKVYFKEHWISSKSLVLHHGHFKSILHDVSEESGWLTKFEVPEGFRDVIFHVGRTRDQASIFKTGLAAGEFGTHSRRQATYFSMVHPLLCRDKPNTSHTELASVYPFSKQTRDALYVIGLNMAQRIGLKFYQTLS